MKIGIAAQVAVYAGSILLFLANLFFTQRIVRAQHPHVGWSKPFSISFPVLFFIIVAAIISLIVGVIYSMAHELYSLSFINSRRSYLTPA